MSENRFEAGRIAVEHLGYSGLRLTLDGAALAVDAPRRVEVPLVVTWTERERVEGARLSEVPLAGAPAVLAWLGRTGTGVFDRFPVRFGGFRLIAREFAPIPYATLPEALRKTWSAVRSPRQAVHRVAFTLKRPDALPLVVRVERAGLRVALLSQALHRFVTPDQLAALVAWTGPVDLAVAGTDYDDEAATGTLLGAFDARDRVIADLTGPIRRDLRLPVRPLDLALAAAPAGTRALCAK